MSRIAILHLTLFLACQVSHAALIASDSFLIGGVGTGTGNYAVANLSDQSSTGGTTGYTGNWVRFTGAVQTEAGGLSNPLVTNPPSSDDGNVYADGVNQPRSQIRQLATFTSTATDYYMSGLMRSSISFPNGTNLFGLGGATASDQEPTVGLQVGFTGGGDISFFYRNGTGTDTSAVILDGYTVNTTYMFVLHLVRATGAVDLSLFDSAGDIVGTPATFSTTTNVSADLTHVNFFVSSNFNAGAISEIRYDEFRFGTALSDVMVVPEPSAMMLGCASIGLICFRRKR